MTLASLFGTIECDVCLTQNLRDIFSILWNKRYPYTHANLVLYGASDDWVIKLSDHTHCNGSRVLRPSQLARKNSEFISSKPRYDVVIANGPSQTQCDVDKNLVAYAVTINIIAVIKAVQVEKKTACEKSDPGAQREPLRFLGQTSVGSPIPSTVPAWLFCAPAPPLRCVAPLLDVGLKETAKKGPAIRCKAA